MTPIELQRKGFQALVNSLGIVDDILFIHQYDNGSGDYTKDRHQWLDQLTMEDILTNFEKNNNKGARNEHSTNRFPN